MTNLRQEATTMNGESVVLTSSEWDVLSNRLPGLAGITGIRDYFKPLLLPTGGDLPADGFYIILEGEVLLSRSGEEMARLGAHDFFTSLSGSFFPRRFARRRNGSFSLAIWLTCTCTTFSSRSTAATSRLLPLRSPHLAFRPMSTTCS